MKVFVTTGAIAPYKQLLDSSVDARVLDALAQQGYTELVVQHGNSPFTPQDHRQIKISGFDFDPHVQDVVNTSDLVISHAGTGSIMDAVRAHKKLIVVANSELMGNHQMEIAAQFAKYGYLIVSGASPDELVEALNTIQTYGFKRIPAANSKRVAAIIEREAGLS